MWLIILCFLTGLFRLCQKFHLNRRKDDATGLWCAVPRAIHNDSTAANLSLVRNLFPYHMEKGIEHYVLWKLGGPPGAACAR